jgi:hypothetical protein
MLNKLESIFHNNDFETVFNKEELKVLKRNDNSKFEYFVIIELNDLSNVLTEKQLAYFEILKKNIADKEVDKNSTLLICFKKEYLPLQTDVYKKILEIEEDPYYFRKLVLPYTQQQLEKIKDIKNFNQIIEEPTKFEEFKRESASKNLTGSIYEIVSQLYIKLPFFKLPVITETKNIVLDEYRNSLNEKERNILLFLENISLDDIKDDQEFFQKLEELKS